MRVHVAFTPGELTPAPVGVVGDVLRASSTICQALASGYRRVLCCAEVDDARALAESEGPAKLAGERRLEHIEGFDFGNSPREVAGAPAAETLILTTTNGTGLLVAAAARFEQVLVGSLLNLEAVATAAQACCGACRTCMTTNAVTLAMAGLAAAGAYATRLVRQIKPG